MSRRPVRRPLAIALALGVLLFAVVFGYRWYVERKGRAKLAAAVAVIEATEPRWRWEDLQADEPAINEAENSAVFVAKFNAETQYWRPEPPKNELDLRARGVNHLLSNEVYTYYEKSLCDVESTWPIVKALSRRSVGRYTKVPAGNWLETSRAVDQSPANLTRFLHWLGELQARDVECDHLESNLLARFALAHIDSTAPFSNRFRRRMDENVEVCQDIERALALDSLHDRLVPLQQAAARAAAIELIRPAIRQRRAEYDRLFRAFTRHETSLAEYISGWHFHRTELGNKATAWLYRPHMPEDWACFLDFVTAGLSVADLPEHKQLPALGRLISPPADQRHLFSAGLDLLVRTEFSAGLASRAMLRCTVVALAAEIFRLRQGSWPSALVDIPKSILPALPVDPFTGEALQYTLRPDGVTIYSVGINGLDDGGIVDFRRHKDYGFRLYDVKHRRLPATENE